ncbi:MAG: S41 family peptidase [Eubacterium sp.]|nr:S41 family peptidase [Eubacterium sp.]
MSKHSENSEDLEIESKIDLKKNLNKESFISIREKSSSKIKHIRKAMALALAGTMVMASLSGCGSSGGSDSDSSDSSDSSSSSNYDFNLFGTAKESDDEKEESSSGSEEFSESSKDVQKKTKEIEGYIDNYFYFEEDDEKREESYFDGIMNGLDDPYSVYYTKEEYEEMMEEDSGEFEGIGAVVSKDVEKGWVYVVKPIVGSPAEEAGILPNDVIVSVDDLEITSDMELDYVVDHIRGEKGSEVVLTIYREGEADYLEIPIKRATIETETVTYEMLEDKVGYIKVENFIATTPKIFKEAVDSLKDQGAEGLVIDLRDNPGGLLSAVIEMVDYVIDDNATAEGAEKAGLLLQTKDKNDNVMEEYTCSDGHSVNLPISVLTNGNSASASEIFAGCLQDYGVAKTVGTTTFGKGIVQSVIKLEDGSAIKITIAQYFIPSGNAVHKVGVEPDIEVELDEEQKNKVTIEREDDNQLQEAIKALD